MEETAIRWRNARAELSGALLRASEVEKRYAVSGSMIKVGGAETLGASRVWWRGAARLRSKAQRLDHGVTGCHVVSWGRKKGRFMKKFDFTINYTDRPASSLARTRH